MDQAPKPRVCAVSYLNTVPLVWGMLHGEQHDLFDLSFSLPADCADWLAAGRADIGIVPAAELVHQELEILRGSGIACHGPVRSILLISKVPFREIRRFALDSSSRTSAQLARIILDLKYGVRPEFVSHVPELAVMLGGCDACLIIGDPALRADPATLPFHVLDLGREWVEMTGLPMVFAVWAARPDSPWHDPAPFNASLKYGMEHMEDMVEAEYRRRGVSRELAREYLSRHIVFELGGRDYQGLDLFLKYVKERTAAAVSL